MTAPKGAFAFYCLCGAGMTGAVKPDSGIPDLEALFRRVHDGPGHGPTTRAKAAYARRKSDDALRSQP